MYSVTKLPTVMLTSVQYLNAALSCKVLVLFLPFPLSLILTTLSCFLLNFPLCPHLIEQVVKC